MTTNNDSVFVVDDSNLASITYETPDLWFPRRGVNTDLALNGTLTSGILGARATFTYTGTSVEVIGLVGAVPNSGPPAVQFTLDGKIFSTTVAPNNGSQESFAYLVAKDIPSGQHKLEITVLNATQQYPFALDAILYLPATGVTATGGQSSTTTVFLPAPTSTSTPQSSSSSKSSGAPIGAIVGGVVGGIAVLIAAGIAIWYMCFRRRRGNGQPYFIAGKAKPGDLLESESEPKPYNLPPSTAQTSTFGAISQYQPSSPGPQSAYNAPTQSAYSSPPPSNYSAPSGLQQNDALSASGVGSSSGASTLQLASGSRPAFISPNTGGAHSKAAEAGLLETRETAQFRQHGDSGIRFNQQGEPVVEDVPPEYTAS